MCTVLITGASGLVGRQLCQVLAKSGMTVVAAVRGASGAAAVPEAARVHVIPSIESVSDWSPYLLGIDVVVHLAAIAHVPPDANEGFESQLRRVNVDAVLALAQAAHFSGVSRFIFISSIKAVAERSRLPITLSDQPKPEDAYGRAKLLAEQQLAALAAQTSLDVVVVRPVLVVSPELKGNLRLLAQAIRRHIPLPFLSISNRRSVVSLVNLCDLIRCCIVRPEAAGQTFFAADSAPLSTREIVQLIGRQIGVRPILVPFPVLLLRALGAMLGRGGATGRLVDNLEVDMRETCSRLSWSPPVSTEAALLAERRISPRHEL